MTSRAKLAWAWGLTTLLLTLTLLVSLSAGTALGRQGTPTPSTPSGDNPAEAQRLLDMAYAETERLDDFNIEAVILLALRSLQASYLPEADLLLTRMLDRMATVEMIYSNPRDTYQFIYDLAVSPDGRVVISAENDGMVRAYEVQTGRLLGTWPVTDQNVYAVAFSPDNRIVAAGGSDGRLRLLDSTSGDTLFFSTAYDGEVADVAFSADGQMVAVVTTYGEMGIYQASTGNRLREVFFDYELTGVEFSPDGQTLMMTDAALEVQLWDIGTGDLQTIYIEGASTLSATFRPDGKTALVANGNRKLHVLDLSSGAITDTHTIYQDGPMSLRFSPDGGLLLVGSEYTPQATLYDARTWEVEKFYAGSGYTIGGMAFAPDGQAIFLGMDEAKIHRVAVHPTTQPGSIGGHTTTVTAAAYAPDGLTLLTADTSGVVNIWDGFDQHLIKSFSTADTPDADPYILQGGFVNATTIWTANFDLGLTLWDIQTGERQMTLTVDDPEGSLYGPPNVAISPDGRLAALSFYSNRVFLFDLTNGEPLPAMRQNNGSAGPLTFSADGTRLAVAGTDARVRVFDVTTGRILKVLGEFADEVYALAFTPDATQVLVGMYAGRLQIVDIASGDILRTFQMERDGDYGGVSRVAFSADTVRVMGLSDVGMVQIWDVPSADPIRAFANFGHSLGRASFSPDESHILTTQYSGAARLWPIDLAETIAQACAMLSQDFSAAQLEAYGITETTPPCPDLPAAPSDAIAPTWTPNPTGTLPVWTLVPTLPPTNTPTATPTPRQFSAQVGENRGELAVGEVQQWTYEGQPGQAITIELRADRPANDTDDPTRARDNLLDAYLRVYTTFGVLLAENDDITAGVDTNSLIVDLTPPYPGTVVIEVTSFEGRTGGGFTLIITAGDTAVEITPTANGTAG